MQNKFGANDCPNCVVLQPTFNGKKNYRIHITSQLMENKYNLLYAEWLFGLSITTPRNIKPVNQGIKF